MNRAINRWLVSEGQPRALKSCRAAAVGRAWPMRDHRKPNTDSQQQDRCCGTDLVCSWDCSASPAIQSFVTIYDYNSMELKHREDTKLLNRSKPDVFDSEGAEWVARIYRQTNHEAWSGQGVKLLPRPRWEDLCNLCNWLRKIRDKAIQNIHLEQSPWDRDEICFIAKNCKKDSPEWWHQWDKQVYWKEKKGIFYAHFVMLQPFSKSD